MMRLIMRGLIAAILILTLASAADARCRNGWGTCPGSSGCAPLGSKCCGDGRYCRPGTFCGDGDSCCPNGSKACRGGGCCSQDSLCTPEGCLSKSSRRVCGDGTYCNPGHYCGIDDRCYKN
jgi:hypothetical protein